MLRKVSSTLVALSGFAHAASANTEHEKKIAANLLTISFYVHLGIGATLFALAALTYKSASKKHLPNFEKSQPHPLAETTEPKKYDSEGNRIKGEKPKPHRVVPKPAALFTTSVPDKMGRAPQGKTPSTPKAFYKSGNR